MSHTEPPLPNLAKNAAPFTPQWTVHQTVFEIDAQKYRSIPEVGRVYRTPFRKGNVTLSKEGIQLDGIATIPPRWVLGLGCLNYPLYFLVTIGYPIVNRLTKGNNSTFLYFFASLGVLYLLLWTLQYYYEYKRVAFSVLLRWEEVKFIKLEKTFLETVITYEAEHPILKRPEQYALQVFHGETSRGKQFVDSLARFAPEKIQGNAFSRRLVYLQFTLIALLVFVLVVGLAIMIFT